MDKLRVEIEVFKDYAMVFGQRVNRPRRVSPSQWYALWNAGHPWTLR